MQKTDAVFELSSKAIADFAQSAQERVRSLAC
jgi:hypothetical protein